MNNYKKVYESWELEDRSSFPKAFGNRKKASDKRFYKRQASKAVRRHGMLIINAELTEDDSYNALMTLKAMLVAKRDMLIEQADKLDELINNLPV